MNEELRAARDLCTQLLAALKTAQETSDGYRDLHAAWQRWGAVHAPDAIGDEAKRAEIVAKLQRVRCGAPDCRPGAISCQVRGLQEDPGSCDLARQSNTPQGEKVSGG